jgi:hypothetical protein
MDNRQAKVTCTECGFEWYGSTSAHALRTVGCCTRCRGRLHFHEENGLPLIHEPIEDVPAHLVLGNPRF